MNRTAITTLKEHIQEVQTICEKHGYLDKIIMPYGYPVKIRDFIKPWDDLRDSYGLRLREGFIFREVRILRGILQSWAAFDDEPKVMVKFLQGKNAGKTKLLQKSLAETFLKMDFISMA